MATFSYNHLVTAKVILEEQYSKGQHFVYIPLL